MNESGQFTQDMNKSIPQLFPDQLFVWAQTCIHNQELAPFHRCPVFPLWKCFVELRSCYSTVKYLENI